MAQEPRDSLDDFECFVAFASKALAYIPEHRPSAQGLLSIMSSYTRRTSLSSNYMRVGIFFMHRPTIWLMRASNCAVRLRTQHLKSS